MQIVKASLHLFQDKFLELRSAALRQSYLKFSKVFVFRCHWSAVLVSDKYVVNS